MTKQIDISVVISTYNRGDMLKGALESLLSQQSGGVGYEVIVVDNNSTDQTREVVESFIARGHENINYVFEPRQGVSYGRNTGIEHSRAPIIAFTDDDVRAGQDWIANIKRAFDEHPEADFVGGKVLPEWKSSPPAWLTRDHWWPLALLDFGDKPFYVNKDNPTCLPTANASFRREAFERIGLFSPDFSGREDHELLVRLWRAGRQGIYIPGIFVTAEVQPERLRKAYHRRWNIKTGKFNSLMRLNESMGADGRFLGEIPEMATLFGVPGFVYRNMISESFRWVAATARRQKAKSQQHKNRIWYLIGYVSKRYEQNAVQRKHSSLTEIGVFMKAMLRKKLCRTSRQG